jgi:branched-chain amino acid transport system substrate-binding protein
MSLAELLRCLAILTMSCALSFPVGALAAPSGPPVRIGSTLALTGGLSQTAIIHKIASEIAIERLNRGQGLIGRPVEWVLLDDQSRPDQTRTLYERLVTVDKVDLLMGPYATASILSAIAVAQRHQKVMISCTLGIPSLSTYERHFPSQVTGPDPAMTFPAFLLDALASTGKPPKTIAIVTSKFPSVHFISVGARDVAAKRGVKEVLYLEYEAGTRDFAPIATRVKLANADFLWMGAIGVEGNMFLEALKKLDYTPRGHFYLFPSPGPMLQIPEGKYAFAVTSFGEHPPFLELKGAAEFVKAFREQAAKANLAYHGVETQAAGSYAAWQVLEAAVNETRSLDDKQLAQWLKTHRVDSILGKLRFDGPYNFGDSNIKIQQIQDGKWVVVWPKEWAAPGVKPVYQGP